MRLTRKDFGDGLLRELRAGYDPVRLSRWAYRMHLESRELEVGLEATMLRIIAMEEGPEFCLSEGELLDLGRSLQADT